MQHFFCFLTIKVHVVFTNLKFFHSGGPGHKRTASKTDFILPPDHDEREKKRSSLQREPQASQQTRLVLNQFFSGNVLPFMSVYTYTHSVL